MGLTDRLDGLADAVAGAARSWVPPADLDDRDPEFIRLFLPALSLAARYYFRAQVRGLENIPAAGPVLLVGNHSGGNIVVDTGIFTLAFTERFGPDRLFYQLAHNLVMSMPHLRWLRRFGTVAASPGNTRSALAAGAAVLVYPGGDWETHRPSWETGRIDFDGRKGFLHLTHRMDVPIVPVVSLGGQETALFLSRGDTLARALRLDRMFRLKVLPISLALPWGLDVGDLLGHFPLPAKIRIQVLEPVDLRDRYGDRPDWPAAYDDVVADMQKALDGLQAERRQPFLG